MFRTRTKTDIIQSAINDLASQSSIANLAPGSKARAVVEAIGNVVAGSSSDMALGHLSTLLPNAQGATLDLLADMVGIQRLPEIRAKVGSDDTNLKYYVQGGTFGDINSGVAITIPAGTEIKTSTDRGRADAIMIQRSDVTLPVGANHAYFAADQIGDIRSRGIAANALTRHNFTGYTDAQFQALLVTNEKGVAGRPLESDQNLRFRINNQLTASAEANITAIRLNALLVPGVSDIRVIANKSGIGTFDVVIFGISPIVPDSVISDVQTQIDSHQAVGMRGIAVGPRVVGLSMTVRLTFADDASASEKNAAANAVRNAIRAHVIDKNPGERFIINDLVRVILEAHTVIKDMGDPTEPFDQLLIWRQTSSGDSRFSRNLTQNFTIADDEELLVEPYLLNPIQVLEA